MEQLAAERIRGCRVLAEQRRQARRQRTLRRARRMARTAERRMIQAWRRAAELDDHWLRSVHEIRRSAPRFGGWNSAGRACVPTFCRCASVPRALITAFMEY